MGYLEEIYILHVIDLLEKEGKSTRPVDIIDRIIAENYDQHLNPASTKAMFFKKRKILERDELIKKVGKNYRLTAAGRKELVTNLDKLEKRIYDWQELITKDLLMSYAAISTPYLIAERRGDNKLDETIREIRDLLEKKGINEDYQIFIRHKGDRQNDS